MERDTQAARLVAALRRAVAGIIRETIEQIQREIPDYRRFRDPEHADMLEQAVEHALGHFVDLIGTPRPSTPAPEVLAFFHRVGIVEAKEGRSLSLSQQAMAIGTQLAVRRFAEAVAAIDIKVPTDIYGQAVSEVFPYLDKLLAAMARGYAETSAASMGDVQDPRHRLLDRLIAAPPPAPWEVRSLALWANWPVPKLTAAVALYGPAGPRRPALPPQVLDGLHHAEPCLVVPDPDGPGRRKALEAALPGWVAVIGPAVRIGDLTKSLQWARQGLDLVRKGLIPQRTLIAVTEHVPTLLIYERRELVGHLADRLLGPLAEIRPQMRRPFAETLLVIMECGFNAPEAAGRLHLHPQTVRYRLRTLKELFGDDLRDPGRTLDYLIALRAWLAAGRPQAPASP